MSKDKIVVPPIRKTKKFGAQTSLPPKPAAQTSIPPKTKPPASKK